MINQSVVESVYTICPIFIMQFFLAISPIWIFLCWGCKSLDADHVGSHLGKAQGLATLLRSVPHNVALRSLPLPSDLLASNGVSQEAVFRGTTSAELADVIFQVASAAKVHLNKVTF